MLCQWHLGVVASTRRCVITITEQTPELRETDFVNAAWRDDISPFAGRHEVGMVGEAASTSL